MLQKKTMKYGNRIMEKISSKDRKKERRCFQINHYIRDGKKKKLSSYSMVG